MEVAAAKLALSTLSPIISKLASYAYDSNFGGDVTAEEMRNLSDVVLFKIKTVIQEAEFVPLDQLRPWLVNLQAAAFEAEDLLDLYEYKKIKNKFSSLPNLIKKPLGITKETIGFMLPKSSFKVSLEKLQKSADESEKLLPLIKAARKTAMRQLEYKSPQASTNTSTVSTLSSPVFGRQEECDSIVKFLIDDSNADSNRRIKRIPMIIIKGIGGSGKTATAQAVYNDDRVKNYFDLSMWVHVSRSFDVHRLTVEIIESANNGVCPQINNLNMLHTKLKEKISKTEKFLLVLDDVWCKDRMHWDQLLCPLNEVRGEGSKVIITTRMEEVASILQVKHVVSLKELKTEDCWSILKHYAYDNYEEIIEDKELVGIGNQIISKVKYSPLALRVVGSLLGKRLSVIEWEKILKHDMMKETMDVLLLSFQHLPSHLQRCFAYCSLFPKGYKFYFDGDRRKLLIFLWIAQGFIENTSKSELTLEEKGCMYFEELLSYSFFQKNPHGGYVIHDLLHDLAEKVSNKHCLRIEDNGSFDIPATCIHLSMYKRKDMVNIDIPDTSKLKKLRTLIIFFDAQFTNIFRNKKDIFQKLTKLRVLYVESDWQMEVLGNPGIDKLKHLRYLKLHFDKKLPGFLLAKLYHLQFLYLHQYPVDLLQGCKHLKANSSPRGFENLINLRTFVFDSGSFTHLDYWHYYPEMSIEKLTSLQNLAAFHPKKDVVNGMMPLKNLHLCGLLSIKNLENVKSKAEAAEAMLNLKKNLSDLTFEWSITSNSTENSTSSEDVLGGLEPHPNLEKLTLRRYQGVKVPNWMIKENFLPRLHLLFLSSCKSLKEVPYLPPHLERLYIDDCHELIQLPPIGSTLCIVKLHFCPKLIPPSMSNKCLRLVHLEIIRCSRNKNQVFTDLPFLANLQVLYLVGFPNLRTLPKLSPTLTNLWIKDFPNLTCLGNSQLLTSLEEFRIEECPMLVTDEHSLMK